MRIFATAAPGLEPLLAREAGTLGLAARAVAGGIEWDGDAASMMRANLELRTAGRVVVRLAEFRARGFAELERHARRIPWDRWIPAGTPVRLRVSSKKSKLYHEGAIAERILAVIGARSAAVVARSTDEETEGEDAQLLIVRFHRDVCTISADASGALLHRRGYRQALAKAPLRETLAAALVAASGWSRGRALIDPLCGSGTIVIEAALVARAIAPGLASADRSPRRYAFERWAHHDPVVWARVIDAARARIHPDAGAPIVGSDRDAGAIAAARANAERAGVADDIVLEAKPVSALRSPGAAAALVANPPWGVRVGERGPLRKLYASLGAVARRELPGGPVTLLVADTGLESQLAIPLAEVARTSSGGIAVRIVSGAIPADDVTSGSPRSPT